MKINNNFVKKYSSILSLLLLASCSPELTQKTETTAVQGEEKHANPAEISEAEVQQSIESVISNTEQRGPKHVIFMIHGFLGDHTTFIDADTLLEERYTDTLSGEKQILATELRYSTFNHTKSAIDFSQEVRDQIVDFYKKHELPLDLPYSIVAHSQGGVVSVKFIYRCIKEKKCGDELTSDGRATPSNIQNLITLGTPFWGSANALRFKDNIFKAFKGQLEGLAFGSLSLTTNRKELIRFDNETGEWVNPLPESLRVINVAGDVSNNIGFSGFFRPLVRWITRANALEFDMVVDTSGARIDSQYYRELNESPKSKVLQGQTRISSMYIPVIHPHVPLLSLEGLAAVTKKGDGSHERHVGYRILKAVFDNYFLDAPLSDQQLLEEIYADLDGSGALVKDLDNFTVDIKLYMPSGYQRKPVMDKNSISMDANKYVIEQVNIGNSLLSKYNDVNGEKNEFASKHFQAYVHAGMFNRAYSLNVMSGHNPAEGLVYYYLKQMRGWKEREFTLKVSPSFSTYAEMYMTPYLPIPNIRALRDPKKAKEDPTNTDGRHTVDFGSSIAAVLPLYRKAWDKDWNESGWIENAWDAFIELFSSRPRNGYRIFYAANNDTGTLRDVVYKMEDWDNQNIRDADKSSNMEALKQLFTPGLGTKCYVGYVGEHIGTHQGFVTKKFDDTPQPIHPKDEQKIKDAKLKSNAPKLVTQLYQGKKVYIVGRYSRGVRYADLEENGGISPTDKYLVTNSAIRSASKADAELTSAKGLGWINVVDIDIDQDGECDYTDL